MDYAPDELASDYIGQPDKPVPGNTAYVEVLDVGESTDASDKPCVQLRVKFLRPFINYRDGQPIPVAPGEEKTWTCGQEDLNRKIRYHDPHVGDELEITFDRMAGRGKHFRVGIERKVKIGTTYANLAPAGGDDHE